MRNPFIDNQKKFPINYNFVNITKLSGNNLKFEDNPYFVKSVFYQTDKYTPIAFYKPICICIGNKIQNFEINEK